MSYVVCGVLNLCFWLFISWAFPIYDIPYTTFHCYTSFQDSPRPMKKVLLLIGFLVVAGVLAVFFRSRTLTTLSGDITDQISKIEDAYGAIVQQYAFALEEEAVQPKEEEQPDEIAGVQPEQSTELTQAQKQMLLELHALYGDLLQKDHEPLQRLNTINRIQVTLHRLVQMFSGHPLQGNQRLIALRNEIGERGEVRALLQEYNAKAKLWNNNTEDHLGSLTATVSNLKQELYPYLRFDGQAATTQYIDLGK